MYVAVSKTQDAICNMFCYEDYMEEQRTRYDLVPTRTTGLWSVHDKKEHSYTWGMTMDEATHYLRQQGVNPTDVTILN